MTRDEIKYMALQELGYTKQPDFNADDDNAVNAINGSYEHIYGLSLVSFPWAFAKQFTQLELEETNNQRYKYVGELPEDNLFLRGVYSDNTGTVLYDYYLDGNKIYVNQPTTYILYTKSICEGQLPAYFVEYLKYNLASKLCQSLTGDTNLLQILTMRLQEAFAMAKNADITQRQVRFLDTGAFTKVRF